MDQLGATSRDVGQISSSLCIREVFASLVPGRLPGPLQRRARPSVSKARPERIACPGRFGEPPEPGRPRPGSLRNGVFGAWRSHADFAVALPPGNPHESENRRNDGMSLVITTTRLAPWLALSPPIGRTCLHLKQARADRGWLGKASVQASC